MDQHPNDFSDNWTESQARPQELRPQVYHPLPPGEGDFLALSPICVPSCPRRPFPGLSLPICKMGLHA